MTSRSFGTNQSGRTGRSGAAAGCAISRSAAAVDRRCGVCVSGGVCVCWSGQVRLDQQDAVPHWRIRRSGACVHPPQRHSGAWLCNSWCMALHGCVAVAVTKHGVQRALCNGTVWFSLLLLLLLWGCSGGRPLHTAPSWTLTRASELFPGSMMRSLCYKRRCRGPCAVEVC